MRRFLPIHAGLILLAVAAPAAAEVPERMFNPNTGLINSIAAIIMFLALLFLLKKFAWGPILGALNDRELKIRTEIESAENARAQATAALDEYQKELAKARADAQRMIQQARADAQKVAEELRARNEIELNAMKNKAKEEIEGAKRAALTEIYDQVTDFSTRIAGKILQREISTADHARLVEDSLAQLASLNGHDR